MTVLVHQGEQFAAFDREPPVDGSKWLVGDEAFDENPRFLFGAHDYELLRLWQHARPQGLLGGGGLTFSERLTLPAKLLDAFDVFEECERQWREAHPRG